MLPPTSSMPHGLRIIFLDLDGTILNEGKATPKTLETLRRVHEAGCLVAVASGRSIDTLPDVIIKLGIVDYYICNNGAAVYDAHRKLLRASSMPKEEVLAAMDCIRALKPAWYFFDERGSYFELRTVSYMMGNEGGTKLPTGLPLTPRTILLILKKYLRRPLKRLMGFGHGSHRVLSVRRYINSSQSGIYKIGCSFAQRELAARAAVALRQLSTLEVVLMAYGELELTRVGVTKGDSVGWLLAKLGIEAAQSVAFGDSENDASLAEQGGHLVAMANASDVLKALADEQCPSVHEDGVAQWLERYMEEAGISCSEKSEAR